MQLVDQTHLAFYFYIPVDLKLVEASVLVPESTCEEPLALRSHYLENIAWNASLGSCFLQKVQNVWSALYFLELGVCCLNKKSSLCFHLISRSDHRGNFYYSYSGCAPIPFGNYESGTHLILNTDFHRESILPL